MLIVTAIRIPEIIRPLIMMVSRWLVGAFAFEFESASRC
jgi:hypothetical protein